MLGFNAPRCELAAGKVFEICCDDQISPPLDGRRQNVAIIRIRQLENANELIKICNKRVAHMGVHQVAGPLEPFSGKVVSASEQSVDPFIMHSVRPFGAIQVRNSKFQKQVA